MISLQLMFFASIMLSTHGTVQQQSVPSMNSWNSPSFSRPSQFGQMPSNDQLGWQQWQSQSAAQPQQGVSGPVAKRRLLDLFSLFNKRAQIGGGQAEPLLPVQTRSFEAIRENNCYFSPIQCFWEERKRRSVPMGVDEEMMAVWKSCENWRICDMPWDGHFACFYPKK